MCPVWNPVSTRWAASRAPSQRANHLSKGRGKKWGRCCRPDRLALPSPPHVRRPGRDSTAATPASVSTTPPPAHGKDAGNAPARLAGSAFPRGCCKESAPPEPLLASRAGTREGHRARSAGGGWEGSNAPRWQLLPRLNPPPGDRPQKTPPPRRSGIGVGGAAPPRPRPYRRPSCSRRSARSPPGSRRRRKPRPWPAAGTAAQDAGRGPSWGGRERAKRTPYSRLHRRLLRGRGGLFK